MEVNGITYRKRLFVSVFILVQIILSSFYADVWVNANTTSRALPIITYFEEGEFRIDKYHELTCDKSYINGHYYTDKAPLPTMVVMPFFGLLVKSGIISPDEDGNLFGRHIYLLGGFLVGTIPFVIAILIIFLSIAPKNPAVSPVILAMKPFYASFLFVFSGSYFAHLFAGILLLGSYLYLKKENYYLAGIFAGLTFLSEYNLAVIFPVWALLIIYNTRHIGPVIKFAAGSLPSIIFIIIYNYIFTGSPFEMLYKYHTFSQHSEQYGFLLPNLKALWGLSFSWYRGMFFFAPFLIFLMVYAIRPIISMPRWFFLKNYLVLPAAFYFLFMTSFFAWWGGWTYGPRFLTGIVILIFYEGIRHISKNGFNKPILYITLIFGIICSIMAKITICYALPTGVMNPMIDLIIPAVFKGDFNPNNLLTLVFNVDPAFSMMVFILLFSVGTLALTLLYKRWQKMMWLT